MEPAHARRAFPCMDEPAIKAEWQLKMIRHNKNFQVTYFNTPLESTAFHSTDKDWSIDLFKRSVKMSSYLVAFVVSNFKMVSMKSPKNNVDIEVAGRPESILAGDGDFALKEAAEIIDFFSEYFDTKYPIEKSSKF